MDNNVIGYNIQSLREKRGLSKTQLCKRLNIDNKTNTVDKWENGTNIPRVDTLIKIADVLNCDTDYLVGRQPYPSKAVTDIQTETGLSDEAIEQLQYYNKRSCETVTALNWLIEYGLLDDICNAMVNEKSKCINYAMPDLPIDILEFALRSRKRCNIQPEDDPSVIWKLYLVVLIKDVSGMNLNTIKKWERVDWSALLKESSNNVERFIDVYSDIKAKHPDECIDDKRCIELGVKIWLLTNESFLTLERIEMDRNIIIPYRFNRLIDRYTDELLENEVKL